MKPIDTAPHNVSKTPDLPTIPEERECCRRIREREFNRLAGVTMMESIQRKSFFDLYHSLVLDSSNVYLPDSEF